MQWAESAHPSEIELGLARLFPVLDALGLRTPPFAVVTVGGTNGKGSTVALIEACLHEAGYRVGAYTSPHLIRYNERVRVNRREASDAELCAAFARVHAACGSVPLTYFEIGTLVAFEVFRAQAPDIVVLEVGLGGRLDAVNAWDADVAVITSIGIDHTAWLGPDRESIAREKAGIFRAGHAAICGDTDPPASIAAAADRVQAKLLQLGRDFSVEPGDNAWTWRSGTRVRAGLPFPALRGDYQLRNAACALAALDSLAPRFSFTAANIRTALLGVVLPGRLQVLPGLPLRVFDVAHNPHAAQALAAMLARQFVRGITIAVFGAMHDKDIAGMADAVRTVVDQWYVAPLASPRAASVADIRTALVHGGVTAPMLDFAGIVPAYEAACAAAGADDRILVFGSFLAVGDILARLE